MIWFGLIFLAYQNLHVIKSQILFMHIYEIYMIWFGLVLWQINLYWLVNPLYTYIY